MKKLQDVVTISPEKKTTLIISSSATDWRARRLANDYGSFVLTISGESLHFRSVTHFMEMIKHPEGDGKWNHFDNTSLEFDLGKECVEDTRAEPGDGHVHGHPYNPVLFHGKRRLDYREVLKLCDPKTVKKVAPLLNPGRVVVHLLGKTYRYASTEHVMLIEQAIRAKFTQNEAAFKALLATEGLELLYAPTKKDSGTFPAKVFCDILTNIREGALKKRDRNREAYVNGNGKK